MFQRFGGGFEVGAPECAELAGGQHGLRGQFGGGVGEVAVFAPGLQVGGGDFAAFGRGEGFARAIRFFEVGGLPVECVPQPVFDRVFPEGGQFVLADGQRRFAVFQGAGVEGRAFFRRPVGVQLLK